MGRPCSLLWVVLKLSEPDSGTLTHTGRGWLVGGGFAHEGGYGHAAQDKPGGLAEGSLASVSRRGHNTSGSPFLQSSRQVFKFANMPHICV